MSSLPAPVNPQKASLPARRQDLDHIGELVSAFESETADMLLRTAPRSERLTMYSVIAMLVLAVVLAAFVKLDRIISGAGATISAGGQLYISPYSVGVVREVKVKVGDIVKKGQVLATLDQTLTQADVTQLRQKIDSYQAMLERLTAEHNGTTYSPKEKNSFSDVQRAIWMQRQAEFSSTIANLDAQISGASAVIARYQQDTEQYSKRMKLASDVQSMYEPLVKKGYVSRQQYLATRDSREEMSRLLAQAQNQITAQEQSTAAVRAQKAAFIQKWHADAGAEMVTVRDEYNSATEMLQKAERLLELTTLTSPADAIVLRVGKVSTGSVAQSTQLVNDPTSAGALFTLTPLDAPLEAEMRVAARDVGFIRIGDPVTVKLDAYEYSRHGTAEGKVKTISEGSFITDENNQAVAPYFKVRLAIDQVNLRNVPADFRLMPGSTMTGDITVGSRTILSYLMAGVIRTGSEAMREAR